MASVSTLPRRTCRPSCLPELATPPPRADEDLPAWPRPVANGRPREVDLACRVTHAPHKFRVRGGDRPFAFGEDAHVSAQARPAGGRSQRWRLPRGRPSRALRSPPGGRFGVAGTTMHPYALRDLLALSMTLAASRRPAEVGNSNAKTATSYSAKKR